MYWRLKFYQDVYNSLEHLPPFFRAIVRVCLCGWVGGWVGAWAWVWASVRVCARAFYFFTLCVRA